MKLFGPLYERALAWARHRNAPMLLTVLSFAEAVFFPVMPEIMLAPMALAQPRRAFRLAALGLEVFTVERIGDLLRQARKRFRALEPLNTPRDK